MASQTPMPNESYFLGGRSPASTAVIPCVESDLPRPCDYQELLERAHHLNRYSNFGELSDEFANGLLKAFGNPGEVCVTCNSATAGLSAALIASGVGSNVLIPAFTFPATYGAVRAAGLVPLIMDVDPTTWAIAPERLEAMIKSTGAKAVILVAPFGITTDFSSHVAVCRQHGVTVIIDCAAGLGVKRMTPCDDDDIFEVFSLHATKPLGIGEGGAVFCSPNMSTRIKSALNFGLSRSPEPSQIDWGFNGKLSELHAAVGLAQLERWERIISGRQRFAARYFDLLACYPATAFPAAPAQASWQVFPVLLPTEACLEEFAAALETVGLEARRYYRPSLSLWRGASLAERCPVSEQLASCMIALPVRSISESTEAQPILARVKSALSKTFPEVP